MEQIRTTFSEEEIEDLIEHSGVKGMKWGVWNEETRRKYQGGLGRASNTMKAKLSMAKDSAEKGAVVAKRIASTSMKTVKVKTAKMAANSKARREVRKQRIQSFKDKTSARISKSKEKHQAAKEHRKEVNEQRKELGMPRDKYNKLRDRTLKSHDPSVIAKGMHTLTDDELNQKIDRLTRENKINQLSYEQQSKRAEVRKKKNEALSANPFVNVATTVLTDTGKKFGKEAVDKLFGKGKDKDKKDKDNKDNKDKGDKDKDNKDNNDTSNDTSSNTSNSSNSKNETSKAQWTKNPSYGPEKPVERGGISNPTIKQLVGDVASQKASSSETKKKAKKGREWIIDEDIIDVDPIDYD